MSIDVSADSYSPALVDIDGRHGSEIVAAMSNHLYGINRILKIQVATEDNR